MPSARSVNPVEERLLRHDYLRLAFPVIVRLRICLFTVFNLSDIGVEEFPKLISKLLLERHWTLLNFGDVPIRT